MMKFRPLAILFFLGLTFAWHVSTLPAYAATTPPDYCDGRGTNCICHNVQCTAAEIGPFMDRVSHQCGNLGLCSVCDIEITFIDIGNWILGIVGAIVLLFYVLGGINWLISGGNSDRVKKGKTMIVTASVGLVIIFSAYVAIYFLASTLGVNVSAPNASVNVTGTTSNGLTQCQQAITVNPNGTFTPNAGDSSVGQPIAPTATYSSDSCGTNHPGYACVTTSDLQQLNSATSCFPAANNCSDPTQQCCPSGTASSTVGAQCVAQGGACVSAVQSGYTCTEGDGGCTGDQHFCCVPLPASTNACATAHQGFTCIAPFDDTDCDDEPGLCPESIPAHECCPASAAAPAGAGWCMVTQSDDTCASTYVNASSDCTAPTNGESNFCPSSSSSVSPSDCTCPNS